ncbi:MAG: zf-HC2 domain-containing protein, partial [Bryobacteraceae bacterium]|nr:zf-HC2 domain-containing protein [Bryobacteraceae bacterium]
MQCADFDWKGFVLQEVPPQERRAMEEHLKACPACSREVEALGLTLVAVRQLPQHPIPRRLAFVSDPVFDLPWWRRLWRMPAPAWGFASALVIAMAILGHARMVPPPRPAAVPVDAQAVERAVQAELERRLPAAVEAALRQQLGPAAAQMEARLAAFEQRMEAQRRADLRDVTAVFELLQKRINNVYLASAQYGGD